MSVVSLYKLISDDGKLFHVERAAIKYSPFVHKKLIEKGTNDRNCETMTPIAIPCHSSCLQLIIDWLAHHHKKLPLDPKIRYHDFSSWDREFFKIDTGLLFGLLNASHALGIEDLMNMGCAAAAELIRGKNVEEIRKIYGIKSDEETYEAALAGGLEGTSTAFDWISFSK